ncbi:MAG: hypothetical protein ACO2ZM_07270, partial [Francisellaceae bacterium]
FYPKLNAQPLIDTSTAVIDDWNATYNIFQALTDNSDANLMYPIDSVKISRSSNWVSLYNHNMSSGDSDTITLNNVTSASDTKFRLGTHDPDQPSSDAFSLNIEITFSDQTKINSKRGIYIDNPIKNYSTPVAYYSRYEFPAGVENNWKKVGVLVLKDTDFKLCGPMEVTHMSGKLNGRINSSISAHEIDWQLPSGCISKNSYIFLQFDMRGKTVKGGDYINFDIQARDGTKITQKVQIT